MASITEIADEFFVACEAGKVLGYLQNLLHAECDICRRGRATRRCKEPSAVLRLDEGPSGIHSRRPL